LLCLGGLEFSLHGRHNLVPVDLIPPLKDGEAQSALNFFVFATLAVSSLPPACWSPLRVGLVQNWGSLVPGH
jgi:hypothetical protein